MGNIISAVRDDINSYISLCEKYGEEVQYAGKTEDCYGEHAKKLRARWDDECRERATRQADQDIGMKVYDWIPEGKREKM